MTTDDQRSDGGKASQFPVPEISRRVARACGSEMLQRLQREDPHHWTAVLYYVDRARTWDEIPVFYRTIFEAAELEQQLADERARIEKFIEWVAVLERSERNYRERAEKAESERDEARAAKEKAEAARDLAIKEIAESGKIAGGLENELYLACKQRDEARAARERAERNFEDARDNIKGLRQTRDDCLGALENAQEERDEARAELAEAKRKIAAFNYSESARRAIIDERDAAIKERDDAQAQCAEAERMANGQEQRAIAAERGREAMRALLEEARGYVGQYDPDHYIAEAIAIRDALMARIEAALAIPAGEGKAPIPPVQCKTCWDQRRVYAPPEGINGHARFAPCPDCAEGA